jgi:hypothetical protein
VIGSIEQYATEESASAAINGLRVSVNDACNRQFHKSVLVRDIVDHYIKTELGERSEWDSEATKIIYADYLRIGSGIFFFPHKFPGPYLMMMTHQCYSSTNRSTLPGRYFVTAEFAKIALLCNGVL